MSTSSYDMILMDCQMPNMDGYEATRLIHAREAADQLRHEKSASNRRIPIIALTANATESGREKCLETGMNDYLAKPFRQVQLKAVLKRWNPANPHRLKTASEAAYDPANQGPRTD